MGGLQKLQTVHFLMPSFCLGGKVMKERTKATGTDKKGVCWSTLNPLVLTSPANKNQAGNQKIFQAKMSAARQRLENSGL